MRDLAEMTVADLRAHAKEHGVPIPADVRTRDEIIALLRDKLPAASEPSEGAEQASDAPPAAASDDSAAPPPANDEQPAADPPAAAREPEDAQGDVRPVARRSAFAWWCPFCDFSMPPGHVACAGCGAERDGDEVHRADR